ncbi:MAG: hypothetical protein RML37_11000 [Chitinophagales bacterium]|nr:hypothetical protein [Chitinophagales bacterium]
MKWRNIDFDYSSAGNAAFGVVLVVVLYRFLSNTLLSQMSYPPLLNEESEWVYVWLLRSGLPHGLTGNFTAAFAFDVLLIASPVMYLLTRSRIFAVITTLSLTLYFMIFNMVIGHHYHGLVGAIVVTLPFWTKQENKFALMWQGARYYLLYIFASAALWKIFRGSVFHQGQLAAILEAQQIYYLVENAESIRSAWIAYLLKHPRVSDALLWMNVLLQLGFAVGFITRRYDNVLLLLFAMFVVLNYVVMGILSAELLALAPVLFPLRSAVLNEK